MKKPKQHKRRPTAYDRGQHDLICRAVDVSPLASAPGNTAYEAVCILLLKLCMAREYLERLRGKKSKELVKTILKSGEDEQFSIIPLFGENPLKR